MIACIGGNASVDFIVFSCVNCNRVTWINSRITDSSIDGCTQVAKQSLGAWIVAMRYYILLKVGEVHALV